MDVNFEWYKIFYYTALHLSFTKAAQTLYVTQSSVSQSIKQLEEKLQTPLFLRNKKKIQLTKAGEVLYLHISQAYKHIKVAERKLENLNAGEINIGASDTICKYFLLPYFKEFHKNNPSIKINISNQPSKKTIEMIQDGLLDFGIVAVSEKDSFEGLHLISFESYEEVCIAGEAFYKQLHPPVSLKDLTQQPMITLRKNTHTRAFLDEIFLKKDLHLEPEFEIISVDLILEMVKAGLGLGFVMGNIIPKEAVNKELYIVPLKESLPKRKIAFAISQSLPLSEASALFVKHITRCFEK
jgi:DNA-binding transcriptional LysR family regulator